MDEVVKKPSILHMVIGFPLIFLIVCGFYLLYLLAFQMSPLPDLVELKAGEGTLELFEKTFGLAANLLVASVAIFLAVNALSISQRQHSIELESFLTQTALEVAREAAERSQNALDAASAIMRACTQLAGSTVAANSDIEHAGTLERDILDDDGNPVGSERTAEGYAAEDAARNRLRSVARERTAEILRASRRLVGLISQYPDAAVRDEILERHFGKLFDELATMLRARLGLNDGERRTVEHDHLSRLLSVDNPSQRDILILGYLVSARQWQHDMNDLFSAMPEDHPEVSESLAMDIAMGRYMDLDAALRAIVDWSPKFSDFHNEIESFSVDLIPALVGATLDLANPFRVVKSECRKLGEQKQKEPHGLSSRAYEKAQETMERHVRSAIGFSNSVYLSCPQTISPQLAVLTMHKIVGPTVDVDGMLTTVEESSVVPLYA